MAWLSFARGEASSPPESLLFQWERGFLGVVFGHWFNAVEAQFWNMARHSGARVIAFVSVLWAAASYLKLVFVPSVSRVHGYQSLVRSSSRVQRNLFGAGGPPDLATVTDSAPQWDTLRAKLEASQPPQERDFRKELAEGRGPPNAMANLRIFDQDATAAKRVTFYRDSASWCPYCHKVWMLLEEKQIPYNVKRVNMNCYGEKPDEFWRMQPNGCIPVAEVDGDILRSSDSIINKVLKMPGSSASVDRALDPFDHPDAVNLLRLDQELGWAWLEYLRGSNDRIGFDRSLRKVESALDADKSGPYFLGERFSLIDIMYTPYFERAVASLAYFKGFNIRDRSEYPAINRWLDAMETRESVRASKSDYYTHAHDLPPQLGGCRSESGGAQARADVDGGAWTFPLHADTIESDWGWISAAEARREAAERITFNSERIARFAARGIGSPGFPPVSAELSDPNARPAEDWTTIVDVFLRHATDLLLAGDAIAADSGDNGSPERADAMAAVDKTVASFPAGARGEIAKCLEYLQRRIGVPRDMSLPAARRLRAELGKLIDALRTEV